jgi:long-chain acyl-CoA synthetase
VEDGASAAFESACLTWSGRIAVHDVTGEAISFAALHATVCAFAEQLHGCGVARGDLVAVEMAAATAGNILRLALLRLGALQVEGRAGTLRTTLGRAPDWVVTDGAGAEAVAMPADRVVRVDPSWIRPPRIRLPVFGGSAMIRATTGTTGTPKLRLVTEESLLLRLRRTIGQRGAPQGPALVGYRPGSSPAFNHFLAILLSGRPVVQPRPTDRSTLEALDDLGATTAYLSPFNFDQLFELAEATGHRPRALERIVVGGGALLSAVAARAEAHFGCAVFNTYGSSETGSISMFRVADGEPGVVGRPHSDVRLRFRAPDGSDADPATGGEVVICPPEGVVPLSYPDLAPVADAEGWVATGDVGHLDAQGRICLSGRLHEVLNIGGNKRPPLWFEEMAIVYPGVRRVAAFAVPTGQGSDIVGLAVEAPDDFELHGFALFMSARLGPTFPMQIALVDAIPANAGGKVDRQALRDLFRPAAAAGAAEAAAPSHAGETS